jgi:L-fuconolactonase
MIVDSHCHVSPVWYEPVETLLQQMDRNGVAQAVQVQMLGQFDNTYQRNKVRRYPGRLASVVAVDSAKADAVPMLKRLAAEGASGVRFRPTARCASGDPLAIWRTAESLGLAVSCVGNTATFSAPEFAEVVAAVPRLPIVLEHLGGTSAPDTNEAEIAARRRVFDLARFPNVYLKVPGLGELVPRGPMLPAEGCPLEPQPGILQDALKSFGPERLMWGSDFPPVATREGYANALQWVRRAFAAESAETQSMIFGGTARHIFKLPAV